ncbi:hypothetical protein Poli38472_012000 [Pythium oligandrum]|uniref:glucan 1,3-beta-glucosidase n=1 Tax=Pythium oligandrum TaxID=41045 RepID=A0A8K1FN25_PYTOL|nr:hypothetical protein Poli38472_012000 [Pythium oligandrum]|eukprot:TMW66884.1 hypothetical protein Poli38472_012000 [Pythium oligandrum]
MDVPAEIDTLIRDWALKYNVAVLLSVHGAKGSQSGNDHSAPTVKGKAFWSDYPENVNSTIYVSKFLADRYKDDAAFLGIELLNEPTSTTNESVMTNYYERAYHAIRDSGNDCVLTVMPLLYKQKPESLKTFMEGPKYSNVWLEWHPYFIWGYQNSRATELLDQVIPTEYRNKMHEWLGQNSTKKMFFGEWSLANAGQFKRANAESFEKYATAQVKIMDTATAGWAYWSWRVEGDDYFNGWSMRSVLRDEPLRKIVMQ